ncbi:MAG TPA: response regulator [Pyrinomonadaceae bacterium]|nr:response regulator [Pyrinomonadaceae bacterium]
MPHILLVEDDEIVRQTLMEMLECEGWQVECCADGLLGLSKINSQKTYDLLLLDNEMPELTGLELTRQARILPHRRQTPIIMMSASNYAREARRAGADEFLEKPGDMRVLVETVRRLLASRPS